MVSAKRILAIQDNIAAGINSVARLLNVIYRFRYGLEIIKKKIDEIDIG